MPEGFEPTCMAHPDTYLNKVVVGGADGRLLLYNFTTGRLLYTFEGLGGSPVRCIASSPALDVVGVGLADGCAPNPRQACGAPAGPDMCHVTVSSTEQCYFRVPRID